MKHKIHNPYESILRTIDFFSQNLHVEQISQYGFQLFNDLIQPDHSVIFMLSGGIYTPVHKYGYEILIPQVPFAVNHDDFAMRNGFILTNQEIQIRYFSPELLKALDVEYIMPLISGNKLIGFIFYKGSNMSPQPDMAFMTRFKHLINLALEKACRFEEHTKLKNEIDKRIFNLASLSHTTKLLLSELEIDKINQLCIDVIRELTSSSVTSFSLLDQATGNLVTRAYHDIIRFEKKHTHLQLNDLSNMPEKVILHTEFDRKELDRIFVNPDEFTRMHAIYVVLLVNDGILGFITIGEPVGALQYDARLLDQIENVAGLIHLALTNAKQFSMILNQKKQMEQQTTVLKKINRAVKTINSAESLDELCQVSMDTLQYSFGVEAGFIATFSDNMVHLRAPLGFDTETLKPICQDQIKLSTEDGMIVSYTSPDLKSYFCETLADHLSESNCLIIAPIQTTGWASDPIGCIVVFKLANALRKEQTVLIESLSNSIAPLVRQFHVIDKLHDSSIPNPEKRARELFETYQSDKDNYNIDYIVQMKKTRHVPFESVVYSEYEGEDTVRFNDLIVVFTSNPKLSHHMDFSFTPESFEDLVSKIQNIYVTHLQRDREA